MSTPEQQHTHHLGTDASGHGVDIPLVGFGTFRIDPTQTADAVAAALDAGYRHIDTAEVYGNEAEVGEGLRRGMEANGLARGDVFVTTKLWPGNAPGQTRSAQESLTALDGSLERLGLDFVDLYLVHRPVDHAQRLVQWEGLVQAHADGRARAIGVSNYNAAHVDELLAAGLPAPHADQLELHPYSQKPELVAHLATLGISPIAYSSLAPMPTWRHTAGQQEDQQAVAEDPFAPMAASYGVTEAQLLLRWGVQQGYPVLPKSTNPERMRQNRELFGFTISEQDMARIATMDRGAGIAWGSQDPTQTA